MKKNKYKNIFKSIKCRIGDADYMERNRTNCNHFTRNRKMPFQSLILFMLNLVKQTLQKELTQFMENFTKYKNISKSAFSQCRLKLKPEAFIELNDVIIDEYYDDDKELYFKGYRLLALDTSTLDLPRSDEIIEYFGECYNSGSVITPKARISNLFDVKNELILNGEVMSYDSSDYDLAIETLGKCRMKDLIIFDRGFCAVWFMYYLFMKKLDFVIRVPARFISQINEFWDSDEYSKIIAIEKYPEKSKKRFDDLNLQFEPFKVRLVKVELDNGEIEVLATSLFDQQEFETNSFKELYFKRWPVEINFDHLKNHIEIENFTGLSVMAIKQDFYTNILINNMQTLVIHDANMELQEKKANLNYRYKINRNLSLGFMKDSIIKILMSNSPRYYEEIKQLFLIEPVPIRNNRKNPRNFHKLRRKYNMNNRRAV